MSRPRVPLGRRAATRRAVFAAGIGLLASGCGGSPGSHVAELGSTATRSSPASTTAASAPESGALAFSRCMRSHGVSNFADPNGNGELAKETPQQLGVASSRYQAAQSACQRLLPNGGQPTEADLRQSWSDFRKLARCMRSHGVPNWPDPTRYPQHPERPTFALQTVGIDPSSPQITTKLRECVPLLHGNNPQRLGEAGR